MRTIAAAAAALVLAAGCGSAAKTSVGSAPLSIAPITSAPATTAAPATSAAKKPSAPATSASPSAPPHFATPEAAMRYLAAAWNANDLVDLKHVTDPSARDQLNAMHSEATNLQLSKCTERLPEGDYDCQFTHDYPAGYKHPKGMQHGQADFLVGPAETPGWYMTVFRGCG